MKMKNMTAGDVLDKFNKYESEINKNPDNIVLILDRRKKQLELLVGYVRKLHRGTRTL